MDEFDSVTHVVPTGAPNLGPMSLHVREHLMDIAADRYFAQLKEMRDAIAWRAYSKAFCEAMAGSPA